MAKLKLNVVLKDEKGNALGTEISYLVMNQNKQFEVDEEGNLIIAITSDERFKKTLKDVICSSLLQENPQKPLTGEEKSKRYKLWVIVNSAKVDVDLKTEELVIIKNCILDTQSILIAGQCEELIEK